MSRLPSIRRYICHPPQTQQRPAPTLPVLFRPHALSPSHTLPFLPTTPCVCPLLPCVRFPILPHPFFIALFHNELLALLLHLFETPAPEHHITLHTPFAHHVLHRDSSDLRNDLDTFCYDPTIVNLQLANSPFVKLSCKKT